MLTHAGAGHGVAQGLHLCGADLGARLIDLVLLLQHGGQLPQAEGDQVLVATRAGQLPAKRRAPASAVTKAPWPACSRSS